MEAIPLFFLWTVRIGKCLKIPKKRKQKKNKAKTKLEKEKGSIYQIPTERTRTIFVVIIISTNRKAPNIICQINVRNVGSRFNFPGNNAVLFWALTRSSTLKQN